ncbi:MAG: DUF1501 domain-containing protein, partial [Armatimonas sp.]
YTYLLRSVRIAKVDRETPIESEQHLKPELFKRDGEPLPGADGLVTFQGGQGNLARSPYGWKQYGKSGKWLSDAVPHIAQHADDICFLHGMTAKSNTHGPATAPDEHRVYPRRLSRAWGHGSRSALGI